MKKLTFLTRISFLLVAFFAIDKGLGIFRQIFIARQFVLPDQDVFNVANNVPDMVSALISGGALTIAFTPMLSSLLTTKGRDEAWNIFSRIANLAFLVTGGLAGLISIFAWPLVHLVIAPGLPISEQATVANLMRLDFIATVIFSISGLVMAALQANQHFLLPAMAPILYNLGQIFGAIVLAPQKTWHLGPLTLHGFGLGVYGLVYGVIIGAALHLLIQTPGLIKFKFKWKPNIGLRIPAVQQSLALLGPRIVTMFFIQIVFLVRDSIASFTGTGSITILTYGWMILQVPETLIGTAIGTALLPTLSEQATRGEWQVFKQTIERAVRVLLAFTLPISIILGLGLMPLVKLAFGPKFDASQLATLDNVIQALMIGLAGQSVLEVAVRAFYAQKNAIIPMVVSGLNTILFVGMAFLFRMSWGVVGIALALSLSYTFEPILLFFLLNRRLPDKLAFGKMIWRGLLAALVSGVVVWLLMNHIPLPVSPVIKALVSMGVGGLACLPILWPEVQLLFRL